MRGQKKVLFLNKDLQSIRKQVFRRPKFPQLSFAKKWVDGVVKRPLRVSRKFFRQTPIGVTVSLAIVMVAVMAASALLLRDVVNAQATSVAFEADSVLLKNRKVVRAELEEAIQKARQEKAQRLEDERKAEEERLAKDAEEAKQAEARAMAATKQTSRPVAVNRSSSSSRGDGIYKTGTAYTSDPAENGGWNVTATGENLDDLLARGERVVASNDFALGTTLVIDTDGDGVGEEWRVADRMAHGGKVDFLVGSKEEARQYGRQSIHIQAIK